MAGVPLEEFRHRLENARTDPVASGYLLDRACDRALSGPLRYALLTVVWQQAVDTQARVLAQA